MKRIVLPALLVAACGGNSQPACSDGGSCQSSQSAPRILSISPNTTTLDEKGTLVITVVVTDPDGVDDLIGGSLVDPDTSTSYGAFATSAAEGAYELRLPWHDINVVEAIDAPPAGVARKFVARFYDQAGNSAEDTVSITLHCSLSADGVCNGDCTDLQSDPDNCGTCGVKVPDGSQCNGGHAGCVMGAENTAAACSDGCDNDGDSYVDCNDFNCCSAVMCPSGTACHP